PVKQAVALLALLNAAALLVNITISPGIVVPALLGVTRIALAGILAYGWMLIKALFGDLDFGRLFDTRSGAPAETALVVSNQVLGIGDQGFEQTTVTVGARGIAPENSLLEESPATEADHEESSVND